MSLPNLMPFVVHGSRDQARQNMLLQDCEDEMRPATPHKSAPISSTCSDHRLIIAKSRRMFAAS